MHCPVCGFENRPGARFCNECGSPLQALTCPTCGAINPPNAKFCNECGTRLEAPTTQTEQKTGAPPARTGRVADVTENRPAPVAPTPVSASVDEDAALLALDGEERRVVTILFADMTGSTALGEHLDPEEARLLMAGYFGALAQAIHRHGGTIEKFIGDAVMAVFGAPAVHEDDPDRAVRAGFEMLAELGRFNERRQADVPQAPPLQIRIGINTGEVVAASNAGEGGQFLVTGDAVNVAARLQQYAQPGTILVGARTYRSTRGVIVYQALTPIEVKGKSTPLKVWQAIRTVDSQSAPATQHLRGLDELPTPFIGRSPELSLLDALYERVLEERRPHLITLLGAPGVGKSRLVREWLSQLREQTQPMPGPSANEFAAKSLRPENPLLRFEEGAAPGEGQGGRDSRLTGEALSGDFNRRMGGDGGDFNRQAGSSSGPLLLEGRCPPYGAGITYWPLAEILRNFCGVTSENTSQAALERLRHVVQDVLGANAESEEVLSLTRQLGFTIGLESSEGLPIKTTGDSKEQRESLFRAWRIFFEALARRQPLLVFIDDIHWANEALLDLLEYLAQRVSEAALLLICPARPELLDKRAGWGGGKRNLTTLTLEPLSAEQSHQLLDALISPQSLPTSLRNSILGKAEGNPFFVEENIRMLIDRGILICVGDTWQVVQQDPDSTFSELLSVSIPDTIQGVLAARIDFLSQQEKRLLQHAAIAGRTFWRGALAYLAQELSDDAFLPALEQLRRKDFLQENERPTGMLIEGDVQYSFKHVLVRDVAYGSIPRARRVREHARMAEWLERRADGRVEEFVELLAYHYHQAAITVSQTVSGQTLARRPARAQAQADLRQKAITYLHLAGDAALAKYAAHQSVRHYTAALELLNGSDADLALRRRLHEKLGRACFVMSDGDAAWDHYQQALHDFDEASPVERAHLYQHLTMLATRWRGMFKHPPDLPVIRRYLDDGLALLRDQPETTELALLLASEAFWSLLAYFTKQADEDALEQAVASAERAASIAEKLNHPVYFSEVLDALSSVYGNINDYRAFLEVQKRRLGLVERIRDRAEIHDIYFTTSRAYSQLGDYPQALLWADKGLKEAEAMNSRSKLGTSLAQKVRTYFEWDQWAEAVQWGEKLATFCEQHNLLHQGGLAPFGLKDLAILYYRMGQDERGDHYAQLVEQALGQIEIAIDVELVVAQLRGAQQRLEEARDLLQRVVNQFPGRAIFAVHARLAELAVRMGDERPFDALPATALAQIERSGNRKELAGFLRTRGIVHSRRSEFAAASDDLNAALAIYRELGTRWEEALTLEALAVHLTRVHPGSANLEATDYLEAAQAIYTDLHAEPALARVRSLLRTSVLRITQEPL